MMTMMTRARAAWAACAICAAGAAGCGPGPDHQGAAATASAPPAASATAISTTVVLGEVDQADADSVADAVAVALSVRDARSDTTSQAAWARASVYFGGDLAAESAATADAEIARPPARWSMMQTKLAWDEVESIDRSIDDPVPDTADTALRQRAVTVRAHSADGWSGMVETSRYWLTMNKIDGAWRVVALRSTIDT